MFPINQWVDIESLKWDSFLTIFSFHVEECIICSMQIPVWGSLLFVWNADEESFQVVLVMLRFTSWLNVNIACLKHGLLVSFSAWPRKIIVTKVCKDFGGESFWHLFLKWPLKIACSWLNTSLLIIGAAPAKMYPSWLSSLLPL